MIIKKNLEDAPHTCDITFVCGVSLSCSFSILRFTERVIKPMVVAFYASSALFSRTQRLLRVTCNALYTSKYNICSWCVYELIMACCVHVCILPDNKPTPHMVRFMSHLNGYLECLE